MPGLVPGSGMWLFCSHEPAVIALSGVVDSFTAPGLERAVSAMLSPRRVAEAIVVDLAEVTFLSVAGIDALHDAVDQAAAEHVTLRIALGGRTCVRRVMTATGMTAVLDVYPDLRAALGITFTLVTSGSENAAGSRGVPSEQQREAPNS
ncbi:hypothetical protein CFP71_15155 [Amycolatopsis thailandensis]|uniref:STAS domain-containing protein n=1 Tax=Amycolatopsis thailandensis TaxID=589330 RepID=A0A229SB46_9PSEU|nr:STAS domain-containing protein [Amycolatopsis thailandensis]OXM56153.1 hypothetical protein CFP71_15155 [Amycolatopsis thailandensis]